MTIKEIQQDYYYHCSFEFQDAIIQMWINKTENEVCFYEKTTGIVFHLNDKETNLIGNILHTANNCFFQRRILKEKEQKEKIND